MSLTESTSEPVPAAIVSKPAQERRISKRMRHALTLLATRGMTQRDAASKAGIHENHLSRQLREPHIRVFIERIAREKMAIGTLRASERMVELIDCSSLTTSFDASKHVLGIAGIKPANDAQVSVSIDIKAGYVIDLSEGDRAQAMTLVHESTRSTKPSD